MKVWGLIVILMIIRGVSKKEGGICQHKLELDIPNKIGENLKYTKFYVNGRKKSKNL
jgi:hypothetical protein